MYQALLSRFNFLNIMVFLLSRLSTFRESPVLIVATFKLTDCLKQLSTTKTMGIMWFIFFAVISVNVHCKPVSHTFLHLVEQTGQVHETSTTQVDKNEDYHTEGKNWSSNYTDNSTSSRRPDFINPTKSDWELWSEQYTLMVTKVLPSMDLLWKTMEKTDNKVELLMNLTVANEEINNKSDAIILMLGVITETVEGMANGTGTTNKLLKKSR